MKSGFFHLLVCDLRLQYRQGGQWAALILFFVIILILLPFTIGPDPDLLRRLAPGLIWLAALLMSLLALDNLFIADARDGTLDLMRLSVQPLALLIASKLAALSVSLLGAMLVLLLPAAFILGMDLHLLPVMAASFCLGLPSLVLMGGLIGAVTVGLRRGPALLTLLLVPFYIPVLIFAVSACEAATLGATALPHLCLLGAILAVLIPAAPVMIAAILRQE